MDSPGTSSPSPKKSAPSRDESITSPTSKPPLFATTAVSELESDASPISPIRPTPVPQEPVPVLNFWDSTSITVPEEEQASIKDEVKDEVVGAVG